MSDDRKLNIRAFLIRMPEFRRMAKSPEERKEEEMHI
jgi:hypothetical protein